MKQEQKNLLLVAIAVIFVIMIGLSIKQPSTPIANPPINQPPEEPQPPKPPPEEPEPEPEPDIEPEWTDEQPVRQVSESLGKVLGDIDSHMPAGHIYRDSDKITWGHETTHGIHGRLRQKHQRGGSGFHYAQPTLNFSALSAIERDEVRRMRPMGRYRTVNGKRINVMYPTGNKAAVIDEPNTRIQTAARLVPNSLKGDVYNLYMVQQAGSWGDTPLYVFDEWVSYSNGSAVRLDLNISQRAETVRFMMEFNVYAICVAMACKSEDPQFKKFTMWHLTRAMEIYRQSLTLGDCSKATAYLEKMRTSSDAEEMRAFCRGYFGKEWTNKVLGF